MAGINWGFIASKPIEGESTYKTGYVPTEDSGFTVGSVDLGKHRKEDVRRILQSYANKQSSSGVGTINRSLLNKLEPYTKDGTAVEGRYGIKETRDYLAKTVKFTDSEIKYLNDAKRYETERNIKNTFNNYKPDEKGMIVSDKAFESLDSKTQTILASIAWQYGTNRNRETGEWILKEFWDIRGNKSKIAKKLRGMGKEEYKNRRNTEANYIEST